MFERTENKVIEKWKGDLNEVVVSICCTTYNHEPYIAEAIEGFLIQETDFPFEILIRDDCSTDKTAKIVKEYADKYPQLIKPVFEKENTFSKGVKPMPQLYKIAKGKYIALCEGDDYWTDPLKLQKQVDFLEGNEDFVITYTSVKAFDEKGIVKEYVGGETRDLESVELQKIHAINTLTACFRNVLNEFPPEFQCTKFGDLFLWSLLGAYGKGKFLADIAPSYYRMHEGGIYSQKTEEEQTEMYFLTCTALYSYYSRVRNRELTRYFKDIIFSIMSQRLSIKQIIRLFYEKLLQKKHK